MVIVKRPFFSMLTTSGTLGRRPSDPHSDLGLGSTDSTDLTEDVGLLIVLSGWFWRISNGSERCTSTGVGGSNSRMASRGGASSILLLSDSCVSCSSEYATTAMPTASANSRAFIESGMGDLRGDAADTMDCRQVLSVLRSGFARMSELVNGLNAAVKGST